MAKGLFDCTGKVTVVTGGNGGIGFGFAMGVAKMGGDLAIWARNAEKSAKAKAVANGKKRKAQRGRCCQKPMHGETLADWSAKVPLQVTSTMMDGTRSISRSH